MVGKFTFTCSIVFGDLIEKSLRFFFFFSDNYLILMFAPVHCPTTVKLIVVKSQLGFGVLNQKYILNPFLKSSNAHTVFEISFRVAPEQIIF